MFGVVRAENWQLLTNLSLPFCQPDFSLTVSDNTTFHWLPPFCHFLSHLLSSPTFSVTDTVFVTSLLSHDFIPHSHQCLFFSLLIIDGCPIASVIKPFETVSFSSFPKSPSLLLFLFYIDSCLGAPTQNNFTYFTYGCYFMWVLQPFIGFHCKLCHSEKQVINIVHRLLFPVNCFFLPPSSVFFVYLTSSELYISETWF